ncbi:MAG: dTMP kinase [Anaerolineae bacterium]
MGQDKGFFLVIEGLDGSGKTHLSRALKRILQTTRGEDVELTFEPHDPSSAGLYIRQVLTKRIKNVKARTLALAYALNRADHNDRVIRPFLDGGAKRIMICDRYYLSSLVYQRTDDVSMDEIMVLNKEVRKPDLILFLSVSAETGYERMRKRPSSKELFEENLDSFRRKYHEAIDFLRARGELVVEIDADGTMHEVLNNVLDVLEEHGPDWLTIDRSVSMAPLEDIPLIDINEADAQITERVRDFCDRWLTKLVNNKALLQDARLELIRDVEQYPESELGLLFVGYIQRWGYQVVDRLQWTDLYAYELSYDMPLGLKQRGTALILTEIHHFDLVTKKIQSILGSKEVENDVVPLSHFMFVLDTSPKEGTTLHYEQDAGTGTMSPPVRRIHRQDIADYLFVDVLHLYVEECAEVLDSPEWTAVVSDVLREHQLEGYWERVKQPV